MAPTYSEPMSKKIIDKQAKERLDKKKKDDEEMRKLLRELSTQISQAQNTKNTTKENHARKLRDTKLKEAQKKARYDLKSESTDTEGLSKESTEVSEPAESLLDRSIIVSNDDDQDEEEDAEHQSRGSVVNNVLETVFHKKSKD